jgi:deoxyadenosine/deoxycytidine kinase/8-oxo-dGTP pyrophosphatase MutT (NUDIX family)
MNEYKKYKPVTFIVKGGIGAGKTTLIEKVTEELRKRNIVYTLLEEELHNKQILKDFNNKPKENGFEFQNYIITQRIKQLEKVNNDTQIIIYDRTLLSTRIFTKAQKKAGYINNEQTSKLLEQTNEYVNTFDNAEILYLNPGIKIEKERREKRKREAEENMSTIYHEIVSRTYQKEIGRTYKKYRVGNNEYLTKDKESEEYLQYVNSIVNRLILTYNQQIEYYVINILYRKDKIYLSRRTNQSKSYNTYYQAPGGKIGYKETAIEACIRETLEETGLQLDETRIQHVLTDKGAWKEEWTCYLFMTKLKDNEEPTVREPQNNDEWIPHRIRKVFKGHKILLIPVLKRNSAKIITIINKGKYSYLNTPKELIEKARSIKSYFRK